MRDQQCLELTFHLLLHQNFVFAVLGDITIIKYNFLLLSCDKEMTARMPLLHFYFFPKVMKI